jgi:hypothetical protein
VTGTAQNFFDSFWPSKQGPKHGLHGKEDEACIALVIDVDVHIQTGKAGGTHQAHVRTSSMARLKGNSMHAMVQYY